MKRWLIIFCSLTFSGIQLDAQCDTGSEPECMCGTAPVLCTVDDLDGYFFSMSDFQHSQDGPTPLCPGQGNTQSNNPTWFAFTAWCNNLTLTVTPSNCSSYGGSNFTGVQTAIYADCNYSQLIDCDANIGLCNNPAPRTLNLTGLVIGDVYYFIVDGCAGAYCDITIDVVGTCGAEMIDPWVNPVMGELFPCEGTPYTYTVDDLDGALDFLWYIDGVLQDITQIPDWTHTWTAEGTYTICVDARNDPCVPETDDPLPNCIDVLVGDPEAGTITVNPTIMCPGETTNISVTGYNNGTDYLQQILIVDENGIIVEIITGDMGTYTYPLCGMFTAYSYNLFLGDGSITGPNIGDAYSTIDCNVDCCDLDDEPFEFVDDDLPQIIPPTIPDYLCYDDYLTDADNILDANWMDNCEGSGIIAAVITGTVDPCTGGTFTYTWEVTDLCMNVGSATMDVTVFPVIPASWVGTFPADVTVVCGDPIPPVEIFDVDNLNAAPCNLMATGIGPVETGASATCGDVLTRTWNYTDDCGNVLPTGVQNITIIDDIVPTFDSSPAALGDLICGDPLHPQETLTGTDNCGPPTVTPSVDAYTVDECNGYSVTYRWTVDDNCGNTDEITTTFNILPDADGPVYSSTPTQLADIECDGTLPAQETLSATDNCGNVSIFETVDYTEDICAGATVTHTWTAIDDCNNPTVEVMTFQVLPDTQGPDISMPSALPDLTCSDALPAQETLTATDNCTTATIVESQSGTNGDICSGFTISYIWTATDDCGNTSSQEASFDILPDTEIPVLTIPADETVECGSVPAVGTATATDNCADPTAITINYLGETTSGSCPEILSRSWEAIDPCGNSSGVQTQTITVEDTTPPVFDVTPPDATYECIAEVPAPDDITYTDNCSAGNLVSPVDDMQLSDIDCVGGVLTRAYNAMDDCNNLTTMQVLYTVNPTPPIAWLTALPADMNIACDGVVPPPVDLGYSNGLNSTCEVMGQVVPTETGALVVCGDMLVRDWTVTDPCGNTLTHTQTLTLEDLVPPVITAVPADITLECHTDVPPPENLVWTDNCAVGGTVLGVNDVDPASLDCVGGDITRTWTIDDGCGNVTVETQVITIEQTPPALWTSTIPVDVTLQCGDPIPPTVNLDYTNSITNPDCFVGGSVAPIETGSLVNCGDMLVRNWMVTDDCGNVLDVSQTLTLEDMDPPVFAFMPPDVTVDCVASIPSFDPIDWTDNCDGTGTAAGTQTPDPSTITCAGGVITRMWEYTDACGNNTTIDATITVDPYPDVDWTTALPADVTINCNDPDPVPIDLDYSNNASDVNCLESGTIPAPPAVGSLVICGDSKSYTWEYNTNCGTTITHTQTITLQDIEDPVFVSPPAASITINCLDELPAVQDLDWTDNCDGSGAVPFVEVGTIDPCAGGTMNRTWEFTDACGNGPITFTQQIILPVPVAMACDDFNPCTENDSGIIDCFGNVCNCEGTPKPDVVISGSLSFCSGSSTILDAGPGATYLWSNGLTTQQVTINMSGFYYVSVTDADGCLMIASANVVESNQLDPNILGDLDVCPGATTDLDAGSGFTNYNWSNGNTSQFAFGVGPGIYSVTVSDATGCQGSSSVTVTELPMSDLFLTGDTEFCEGDFSDIFAAPGFNSYVWSNGLTGPMISVNTPGLYTVTATDSYGCEYMESLDLIQNDNPVPIIDGQLGFCDGEFTSLTVSNSNISNYEWSTFETTASIEVFTAGVYTVTVTDISGCTNSTAVSVEVYPLADPVITGSMSICAGGTATLSTTSTFSTYAWSTGSSNQTAVIDQPGFYFVYVYTDYNCEGYAEFNVSLATSLSPTITGDSIICPGSSTTLDAGVFDSYIWDDPDQSTTQTIDVNIPAIYSVTVSDDSGCSGSSSINVLNGASQTLEIMGDTMICPGAFTSLTVDSNFVSYAWSNGLNTPSVIVSDPDTYIVTATSANGCESVDSVMVQELNAPDLSILGPDKYCPGESVSLMANDVYDTYLWSTGETTASIEVDSEMTVELEVTDSEGCTANSSVSIQAFDPATPTIGGSYAFCAGSFTTLDGGSEYVSWSWSTGETDQIIQVDQEITIELTVIDTNGCQGVVTAMITEENTLTPTIIGDDMICAGATGILDGGSGFGSWTWSTGETTQTIMVTEADTYLLTVTDISGNCDGTGSIEVVVNDLPAPEILGTPFFCPDGTTTMSLSQSYDTHLWSNGEEGTSISVDSAGIYFVTVTDNNGCQGSSMVDVTQIDLPIIDLNSVDCSADMLTYQVDVVTDADILETIPPDQTVSTTSSGFLIMDIDVSTDITLILENSNTGCEDQRLVNAPNCNCSAIADAGADQDIFCDQLEVTLGGTGTTTGADFSIEWQDEDGNAISTDEQITVNAGGTYTIFVTDEILQCTEEDQVIVTAFSDPEPIINGEGVICPNSSTLLSLDSSYPEIEWSTGETTQEISVSLQDDYTVTVTDANGCQTSTNFVVDIFSFPSVDFAPECLTGQSVYQYELITQANELTVDVGDVTTTPMGFLISNIPENISVNASLTYDPIDCVESLFLQAPNCDCTAISDAGPDQSLDCNVQTVTLGGADTSTGSDYNYEWTDQGVVVGTDATYTTSTAGVYVLTVTDLLLDCDVIDIVNVDLIPLAEPEIEGADKLCELQTTTLSLTETYAEYAWSTLEDTDQIVVSDAGFYDVTITDDNNCTAVAEWTITSNPSPQLDFTLECSDDNLLYDIDIITDAIDLLSDVGTVVSNPDGFSVNEIPALVDAVLTATSVDGCMQDFDIVAPNCDCDVVADAGDNQEINCNNQIVTLGSDMSSQGQQFEYQWINDAGDVLSLEQYFSTDQSGDYTLIVTDNVFMCTAMDQVFVDFSADPVPLILGGLDFCPDENTSLSVDDIYAMYSWSTGESTSSITVAEEMEYTLVVTDDNGCTGSSSVMVTSLSDPTFSFNVICSGDKTNYDINITTSADILTSDNGMVSSTTDGFVIPAIDTSINVTITLSNSLTGCTITELIPKPDCDCLAIADAGNPQQISCDQDFVTIGGDNSSFGNDFEFQWLDMDGNVIGTTSQIDIDMAGSFTLVVYDIINDCSVSSSVLVNDVSNEPIAIITADPENIIDCSIQSVTLTAENAINSTYEFSFEDIITQGQMIETDVPGTYILTVIDTITGCQGIDSIDVLDQIEYPFIAIDPPQELTCDNDLVVINANSSLTGNNITHQWLDQDGNPIANANDLSLEVSQAGFYYFMSVDIDNDCENIDSVLVTANADLPIVDAGQPQSLPCSDDGVNLQATASTVSGNEEVLWTTNQGLIVSGGNSLNPLVNGEGWYFLTVVDQFNGCESKDSVLVEFALSIPQVSETLFDDPICAGENNGMIDISAVDGGTPPLEFILNGTQSNNSGIFNNLSGGNYELEIIDANGCSWDTLIVLEVPLGLTAEAMPDELQIDLGSDQQVIVNTNLDPTEIDTIIWSPDESVSCTDCLDPFLSPFESTSYTVTIIDVNGCEVTAIVQIRVDKKADIYIGTIFSPNGDNNNDIVFVQSDSKIEVVNKFYIYDRWGELVFSSEEFPPNDPDYGWDGSFKGVDASLGVYVYLVEYTNLAGDRDVLAGDVTLIR